MKKFEDDDTFWVANAPMAVMPSKQIAITSQTISKLVSCWDRMFENHLQVLITELMSAKMSKISLSSSVRFLQICGDHIANFSGKFKSVIPKVADKVHLSGNPEQLRIQNRTILYGICTIRSTIARSSPSSGNRGGRTHSEPIPVS